MSGEHGIDERDLQALVDGRLPTERSAEAAAVLASLPEARARVAHYQAQRQQLRAAFAAQAAEPTPLRLRPERLIAMGRRRRVRSVLGAAAAVLLVLIGGAGGWLAHGWAPPWLKSTAGRLTAAEASAITADALAAHRVFAVEVRHPVEVGATEEAHLIQWLSKRLGRPLIVPDLSAAGFQLMGGRLLPSEEGPAAQLMYAHDKDRLTLYLRASTGGETAFRYYEVDDIGLFYWSDQGFGYALSAKVSRNQLLKIAEIVYQQLSGDAKARVVAPPGKHAQGLPRAFASGGG
jgi:anti-sigma factor RsiW